MESELKRFVAELRDDACAARPHGDEDFYQLDVGIAERIEAAADMLEYVYHPKLLPPFAIATVDALAAKALGNSTQDESPKQSVPPT